MNRKTLDMITILVASLGVCVALFIIATMPGNETVGLCLIGGALTAALLTILI